jgi:hypothetical protein
MGYKLSKSRRKDPDAYDYGLYMIADLEGRLVWNGGSENAHALTLEDVEEWISEETSKGGRS